VAGGFAYGRWGLAGVVVLNAGLLAIWLVISFGMRVPPPLSRRSYSVPGLDAGAAQALLTVCACCRAVREGHVSEGESTVYLQVDSAEFDEQNVVRTITGKVS
jgi:hypothetical protein